MSINEVFQTGKGGVLLCTSHFLTTRALMTQVSLLGVRFLSNILSIGGIELRSNRKRGKNLKSVHINHDKHRKKESNLRDFKVFMILTRVGMKLLKICCKNDLVHMV